MTVQSLLDATTRAVLSLPITGTQKGMILDSLCLLLVASERHPRQQCRHELQGMIVLLESEHLIDHQDGTRVLEALMALCQHLDSLPQEKTH